MRVAKHQTGASRVFSLGSRSAGLWPATLSAMERAARPHPDLTRRGRHLLDRQMSHWDKRNKDFFLKTPYRISWVRTRCWRPWRPCIIGQSQVTWHFQHNILNTVCISLAFTSIGPVYPHLSQKNYIPLFYSDQLTCLYKYNILLIQSQIYQQWHIVWLFLLMFYHFNNKHVRMFVISNGKC